jgi:hypothetical protein
LPDGVAASVNHMKAHFGGSSSTRPSAPQFAVFRTVLKTPQYLGQIDSAFRAADPHAVIVDGETLGYLARAALGGNNRMLQLVYTCTVCASHLFVVDNRVTYVSDNLDATRALSPGNLALTITLRNDAVGQTLTPSAHFCLVQLVSATTRKPIANYGFSLASNVARKATGTCSGTINIPSNTGF